MKVNVTLNTINKIKKNESYKMEIPERFFNMAVID